MELQECWRRFLGNTTVGERPVTVTIPGGSLKKKVHFRTITRVIPNTPSSVPMKMSQNQRAVYKKKHRVSHGVRQKRVIRRYFFVEENREQQWFSASNHCYKVGWNLVCNSPKLTAKSFCKNRANLPRKGNESSLAVPLEFSGGYFANYVSFREGSWLE